MIENANSILSFSHGDNACGHCRFWFDTRPFEKERTGVIVVESKTVCLDDSNISLVMDRNAEVFLCGKTVKITVEVTLKNTADAKGYFDDFET